MGSQRVGYDWVTFTLECRNWFFTYLLEAFMHFQLYVYSLNMTELITCQAESKCSINAESIGKECTELLMQIHCSSETLHFSILILINWHPGFYWSLNVLMLSFVIKTWSPVRVLTNQFSGSTKLRHGPELCNSWCYQSSFGILIADIFTN